MTSGLLVVDDKSSVSTGECKDYSEKLFFMKFIMSGCVLLTAQVILDSLVSCSERGLEFSNIETYFPCYKFSCDKLAGTDSQAILSSFIVELSVKMEVSAVISALGVASSLFTAIPRRFLLAPYPIVFCKISKLVWELSTVLVVELTNKALLYRKDGT